MRKTVGSSNTDYIYDLDGHVVADWAAGWSRGYVYLGGQLLAEYANGTTYFAHKDHLGSTRLLTNISGGAVENFDFYPFGESSSSGATTRHKFTGKERDSESGLDNFGARYFGSSLGRFQTPDPLLNSGRPNNPQTWNRYTYTLNNPLAIVDPTGLYNLQNTCAADDKKCNNKFNKNAERLKKGLETLQKKLDRVKDPVQKARLEASLKSLGTENDGNNVNVSFGALSGTAAGRTDTVYNEKTGGLSFNVTFDPSKINGTEGQAIDAAHEGTHIADTSDPRFANPATTLGAFQQEYRAYQTSAWAAQALGVSSLAFGNNVLWNSSWATVDRQTLMDKGITNHVVGSPGHPEPKPPVPHNPSPN